MRIKIQKKSAEYEDYKRACPTRDTKPDLDFYQEKLPISEDRLFFDDALGTVLRNLCGETLTLSSTRNRRSGIDINIPEDHIILTKHSFIIIYLPYVLQD